MPDKKIKVLIIEDNNGDAALIREMLSEIREIQFDIVRFENLGGGLEFLEHNKTDVVLLDLSLPDSHGLQTFIKLHEKFSAIPAILLTGLNDEELAYNSVQAGAQDYLVKGVIDSTLLSRSILYSIERARLLEIEQNEVAKRITAEEALKKANRALKVLSECNQIAIRAQNEEDLFENICRVLIDFGGFSFAWIILLEDNMLNEEESVHFFSCCESAHVIKEKINESICKWSTLRAEIDEPGNLIFGNEQWLILENQLLFNDLADLELNSSVSLPIFIEKNVIGFCNLYSKEKMDSDEEERTLLVELSDDISLGLQTIRIRKEKEETLLNLKESDERFNFIVNTTKNIVYQLDYVNMKYHYINPAIKDLTGYDIEEINKIGFRNLIENIRNARYDGKSVEIENLKEKLEQHVKGEYQADYQIKTKNGDMIWLTDHSYPWIDENGNLLGSTGIMSDITERIRAEEEIILAKEQAEEMNRLKTNFLSNMSHELRTPMVGILGYSEIMKNEAAEPSIKRMAGLIYLSGTRLMETMNIILELSRLEAGKIDLTFTKVELIKLINTIASFYEDQFREKKLFLKIESDFASLYFKTDERMLRNSINNLVNNAVKFTNNGGVTIVVKLENTAERRIILKIIDTGIGIAKEDQDVMWEEFRQVSEGFNRSYEGSGLGLTITKKFIQKLGGFIDVESQVEKGSVFTINLPALEVKPIYAENIDAGGGLAIKLAEEEEIIKPKVLVVDDDETSRNVMIRFLKEKCIVDAAKDGNDAINKVGREKYDSILMDINLGKGMNGLDATKIIRKLDGYDSIPIVAVTAYAMKGDKEEFLEAGCTSYISKPFSKLQFISFIEEILKIKF